MAVAITQNAPLPPIVNLYPGLAPSVAASSPCTGASRQSVLNAIIKGRL